MGVALLVLALRRDGTRWAGLIGTLWGLAFFLPHLWWARVAAGALPWFALATLQALLVGTGTAIWDVARRARWLRATPMAALAFALAWVTTEQLRSSWPFGGFPWGRLAFSQTDGPLLSLAWLGGAPLISGVVAAAGFVSAHAWSALRIANYRRAAWTILALPALVILPMTIPLDSMNRPGCDGGSGYGMATRVWSLPWVA